MTSNTRSLTLLAAAVALAGCGVAAPPEMKAHDDASRDAVTVCPGGTQLKGVDVSSYQGSINWASVAGAGIKFGYTKATEGTGYQDSTFAGNWSGMKNNGIARGAYHFFHGEIDGTQQADYYLAFVNAHGGFAAGDLPPMLDWEQVNPNNGGASCSTATANATAFINEIKAKTGMKTLIYTSPGIWNGYGCTNSYGSDPLWVADYFNSQGNGCYTSDTSTECPSTPSGWSAFSFWQYGDCGSVAGISGHVDVDIFNGDAAALAALGGATCGGKPDGDYCGNDGPSSGDANSLYKCTSNEATLIQACNGICAHSGSGDFCQKPIRPHTGPDVNGDGKADLCARDSSGVSCWPSTGSGFGGAITGPGLSNSSGWSAIQYDDTITLVDVNGDGKSDVCGRGVAGEMCWLNSGSGFPNATTQNKMTDAEGWNQAEFRDTIQFGDINGDGKLDLCGRAFNSFVCYLWNGNGWNTEVDAPDMGDGNGWNVPQYYSTIVVADVTGDGKADVCGRGWGGFECWISTGTAFTAVGTYVDAFSDTNGGGNINSYSTLQLADIDGDSKLDLCGRTSAGYECYKGDGTGKFPTHVAGPPLSDAQGWNGAKYFSTIQLADINGDGKADVCGRGVAGISCWLSNGSGFPTQITGPALSDASGWGAGIYDSTITFADVDGYGRADLCGRAAAGWQCWLSTGTGFASTAISTTLLSDSSGMDGAAYVTTIQLVGDAFGHVQATTSTSTSTTGTSGTTSTSTTTGTTGTTATSTTTGTTGTTATSTTTGSSSSSSSTTTTTGSSSSSAASTSTTGSSSSSSAGASTSTSGSSAGATTGETTGSSASSTSSTTGTAGNGSTGHTSGTTAASTTGAAAAGGSTGGSTTGGTKSGGCSSADGSSLFGLGLVLLVLRRRKR